LTLAALLVLPWGSGCQSFQIDPNTLEDLARLADDVLTIVEEYREQEPVVIVPVPDPVTPVPVIDPVPVPPPPGPDGFDWGRVVTVQKGTEPMGNWSEELGITNVRIEGGTLQWQFTKGAEKMASWEPARDIHKSPPATLCVVVERDGKLVQLGTEWALAGGTVNRIPECLLAVRGNGREMFGEKYQPRNGERAWLIVSGLNLIGKRNVRVRSNPCPFEVKNMPR